jgi:small redox-active disulfide protein 2
MHTIQVLGPGCRRCETLAANVEEAVRDMGIEARIEKITDIPSIAAMGVLSTPGLAVDGSVMVTGRLLSVRQVKQLLEGLEPGEEGP